MANFVSYANATEIVSKIGNKLDSLQGALVYRGSVAFANLPATLTKAMTGYTYNVTDAFTTDSRFVEGTGKSYPAGTDVAVANFSTYDEATPVGNENPTTEGWYEYNQVTGKYFLSEDTEVDGEKTYYVYTEIIKFSIGVGFIDVSGINSRITTVAADIAPAFDATSAYAIGEIVTYQDALYKFKAAHTANDPWSSSEVDAVKVKDLIASAEPDSLTTAQVNALLALLD